MGTQRAMPLLLAQQCDTVPADLFAWCSHCVCNELCSECLPSSTEKNWRKQQSRQLAAMQQLANDLTTSSPVYIGLKRQRLEPGPRDNKALLPLSKWDVLQHSIVPLCSKMLQISTPLHQKKALYPPKINSYLITYYCVTFVHHWRRSERRNMAFVHRLNTSNWQKGMHVSQHCCRTPWTTEEQSRLFKMQITTE